MQSYLDQQYFMSHHHGMWYVRQQELVHISWRQTTVFKNSRAQLTFNNPTHMRAFASLHLAPSYSALRLHVLATQFHPSQTSECWGLCLATCLCFDLSSPSHLFFCLCMNVSPYICALTSTSCGLPKPMLSIRHLSQCNLMSIDSTSCVVRPAEEASSCRDGTRPENVTGL